MRCAEDGTVRLVSDNAVKIFQLLDGSIYDMAALPVLPVITEENLLSAAVQGGENVLVNIRVVDGVRKVGSRDVTEATAALVAKFKTLAEQNGSAVEVEEWGSRKLAYPINYKTEGYYVLMTFTSEPSFPKELDRVLRITDGIMRSLIVCKGE